MGVTNSTTTGAVIPTANLWADGHSPEQAAEKLMAKMKLAGVEVKFCYGGFYMISKTLPTYYETNIVAGGTIERASVERMISPSGLEYWRARFGGLLCA